MSDRFEIRFSDDKNTAHSLLKFGKPFIDVQKITSANIREIVPYKLENENAANVNTASIGSAAFDISTAAAWEIRAHARQITAEESLSNTKHVILGAEIDNRMRDYLCRKEESLFENSSYFIMKREGQKITLAPVSHWYSLTPTLNYKNGENEPNNIGNDDGLKKNTEKLSEKLKRLKSKKSEIAKNLSDIEKEVTSLGGKRSRENGTDSEENVEKKPKLHGNTEEDQYGNNLYGMDTANFGTLSSDDSQEDLNEEGKELDRILKRGNQNEDSELSLDDESECDSDIDALEKKYSDSSIFKSGKHFDTVKTEEPPSSGDKSKQNIVKDPVKSENGKGPKQAPTSSVPIKEKEPNKINQMEMFLEEKIRKYLSHHNMNTITLLKKLLPHAPPGYTREEIVIAMARILKRIGVQKTGNSGNMFLDLTKK